MNLGNEYLRVVQERFKDVKSLGDKTISQLSEADIHWKLNEASNSVAVIAKHLSGNMVSRWSDFLISDGEKPDRNREQEFEDDILSKQELLTVWEKGWSSLFETLNELESQDLLKNIYIRGVSHTVLEAIERQVAHYAYHIGQVVYIGKQLRDVDWESLSIPKVNLEEYLHEVLKEHETSD